MNSFSTLLSMLQPSKGFSLQMPSHVFSGWVGGWVGGMLINK